MTFSTAIFIFFAIILSLLGFRIGSKSPLPSLVWTVADIVWLVIALVTIIKILNPVEEVLNGGRLRSQKQIEANTYGRLLDSAWKLKDAACDRRSASSSCKAWDKIERQIAAPSFDDSRAESLARDNLKKVWAINNRCDKDSAAFGEDAKEYAELHRKNIAASNAASSISDTSLAASYAYLVIFIFALAFRIGRTGAEWRRNAGEKPVDLPRIRAATTEFIQHLYREFKVIRYLLPRKYAGIRHRIRTFAIKFVRQLCHNLRVIRRFGAHKSGRT